jgi:LysM repeat protein
MITRDAKIGLLVVLAFCLIVGILLSEHFTATGEPRQASLAQAGPTLRQGTNAPVPTAPIANRAPAIDADPQPAHAVVTRDVLDAPVTSVAQIQLGKPNSGEMKVIRVEGTPEDFAGAVQVEAPAVAQADAAPATPGDLVQPRSASPAVTPAVAKPQAALVALASANGLELVPVDANARTSPKVTPTNLTATPKVAELAIVDAKPIEQPKRLGARTIKTKDYVAQSGDSLSRIAARMLGADTPANRAAIVELNPALAKNPERILVGVKYLVPADAWSAALGVDDSASAAKLVSAKVSAEASKQVESPKLIETAKPAVRVVTYEVKSGDSLWKLAGGDIGVVEQIKTLNADVLKGRENVLIGMKLKLPRTQMQKSDR